MRKRYEDLLRTLFVVVFLSSTQAFFSSSTRSTSIVSDSSRVPFRIAPSRATQGDGGGNGGGDSDLLTKASWYAVEAFGKVFGEGGGRDVAPSLDAPPSSLRQAIARIEADNERSYFLSGEVDVEAYDPDCVFSDPFVAFSGRDRFVDNLANLGSFITEYDARMLSYEVDDAVPLVKTKVMVKLELNLPWKPILAWPWGVTYIIDPASFLITEHKEEWDIAPLEGVKQIFRKPTTSIKKKAS